MDGGRWTVDDGRWTMDCGLWTVDRGQWTMDDASGVLAFQRSNVLAFQRSNVPTFQRANVPTRQCPNVPTSQRADVPTFQRSNVPTRQRIFTTTWLHIAGLAFLSAGTAHSLPTRATGSTSSMRSTKMNLSSRRTFRGISAMSLRFFVGTRKVLRPAR